MKKYTFRSLGMLGEMYVGGEEAGIRQGDFYCAEDVRALVKRWHVMLNEAMSAGDGRFEQVDNVTAEMEDIMVEVDRG